MRNRMYGVVRGGWGDPTLYSILSAVNPLKAQIVTVEKLKFSFAER